MVSNQPDVARGTQSRAVVEAINEKLRRHLTVDEIRVCYHDNQDQCACRKPKPGLLLEAAGAWGIDLIGSFIVGDRCTDIEAGQKAGCKAVLINAAPLEAKRCRPDFQAASLSEAAEWILSLHRQGIRSVSKYGLSNTRLFFKRSKIGRSDNYEKSCGFIGQDLRRRG